MAEAFLHILIENLSSLIQKQIGLIMGVDKEMKKLQSTLSTIQSVLEDAETKRLHSKPIQNWMSKLDETAYEIEDLLDECATEVSRLGRGGAKKFNLGKILFSHKIGRRMKELGERLEDLAAERRNFHLREISAPDSTEIDCRRETGIVCNAAERVYGRDEDREKLVELLVNRAAKSENLSVLPIIGVGGLGKTTLAQLLFNEERVLLKKIIEFATGSSVDLTQVAALQLRIRELLNRKKFLLILDDVWNENQESWIRLKSVLDCGSKGASIVVTTRMQKVADIMKTLPTHCLGGLSEEHCWLLLRARAFGQDREEEKPSLVKIGKQIVSKCVGVPLVATALGRLLRFERAEKEWVRVEGSEIWNLDPINEGVILPVLRLSYHRLPLELRRCFAYCGVFPKNSYMVKQEVIFHWMAHGCISSNGVKEVEDVGEQVWNELVLRSLFQEVDDTKGGETVFKMHDLVHDLARSIMENKVRSGMGKLSNDRICEVHLGKHSWHTSSSITIKLPTLSNINRYSRVRILKLNWAKLEKLPNAIGKLKYLRYLDLSYSNIHSLPPTFCSLWNLQILNLNGCAHLENFPKQIRCMTNLRHMFLDGCSKLRDMPSKIRELTCLKTLSLFIVGHKKDNQLDQLEFLNLGGRLEIRHLERVTNHTSAKNAKLVEKPNLRCLVLSWEGDSAKPMDEKVLEALEPHSNLESLEIKRYKGNRFPLWMTKMRNLTAITIRNCPNCSSLPLGYHPRLESLCLWRVDDLEYIVNQDRMFPSLEQLSISHLPNLKGLVKEGEIISPLSNLQRLTVLNCGSPTMSSLFKVKLESLTHLDINFGGTNTTQCVEDDMWPLSNLKELRIWQAREEHLSEQWFRGLGSLTKLDMRQCQIRWLHHLVSLSELHIHGCSVWEMEEMMKGMKDLHLLKCIAFFNLRDVVSLPRGLEHVSSLQSLTLWNLPRLAGFPVAREQISI